MSYYSSLPKEIVFLYMKEGFIIDDAEEDEDDDMEAPILRRNDTIFDEMKHRRKKE